MKQSIGGAYSCGNSFGVTPNSLLIRSKRTFETKPKLATNIRFMTI